MRGAAKQRARPFSLFFASSFFYASPERPPPRADYVQAKAAAGAASNGGGDKGGSDYTGAPVPSLFLLFRFFFFGQSQHQRTG